MAIRTENFDFKLPDDLIAQRPPDQRDSSALLHLERAGGTWTDRRFNQLPGLLRSGDLMVMNDTKVVPARFYCTRPTGGKVEGLFLQIAGGGKWEVMLKNASRCKPGELLCLSADRRTDRLPIELIENLGRGCWIAEPKSQRDAFDILQSVGTIPLPPYIRRDAGADDSSDRLRYQTVYAATPGAVAAPTAGLHFTPKIFDALAEAGVETCCLTLHVGAGTFLPVKTDDLDDHQMHGETYELSAQTARTLNAARDQGRRIVAVGTTTVRVLETLAAGSDRFAAAAGSTDIFIYPPAKFRAVDALITNFHLPKSTLLMLVSAFCTPGSLDGIEMMQAAYRHAVQREYRFFSYGDVMLIE